MGLFRNSDFGTNFCFNSKPSFSFDSWSQRTKFPVASTSRCNHRRIGLESKLPPACFDLQFCHCPLCNHNPQSQNTNNRATTGFQTSKLWVKTRTPYTGNQISPTPQIPQSWKKVFFHISRGGLELFRNVGFGANFCFNSKPSFSFESCRQRTKFPVASTSCCNHRRIGLESKLPPTCFDLQFCHCPLWNHKPQSQNTNNRATTGLQISKLWVKTRTLHTANRASPTP